MKGLLLKWNERILSIKNAYALLLEEGSGCTFKQFRTYSYLVKLGFRVFRHNSELKNNNNGDEINNLTKLPETLGRRKTYNANNIKIDCNSSSKDKVSFSGVKSTGWVILSRPPECYTPYNIQPDYDTYSFNITVSPDTLKITEVISFYETIDLKKPPFYPKPMIIFDSNPTGIYPVYEKTTPETIQSYKEDMCEPRVKRLKYSEIVKDGLPIITKMTGSTASNIRNSHVSNSEIYPMNKVCNALNDEGNMINEKDSFLTTKCALKNKINFTNEILLNLKIEDNRQFNKTPMENSIVNVNFSGTQSMDLHSDSHNTAEFNTIPEDELCEMKLNLPYHIKQKLFAIKPTKTVDFNQHVESISNMINEHNVQFDVYYPDNYVPKTLRSVPDFRIIIFDNDLDTFPNVYKVNTCNLNDNVPTLWAIVNSSSVSFYNVNNIILPKSTDWKIPHSQSYQKKEELF